jgi:hypothetical protein
MNARWVAMPSLLSLLSFACRRSHVVVANETQQGVKSVTIAVSGARLEISNLAAGQSRSVTYRPQRDGCFDVVARLASGATIEASCMGYTTPNEGIAHRLTLGRDLRVQYDVVQR